MRRAILLIGSVAGLCAVLFPWSHHSKLDAGTAVRMDVEGLVEHAELVLEARVRTSEPVVAANGMIETEYLLDVNRTFEGADQLTQTVRLPGGVLPTGKGLLLPGMPSLVPGEDVILFLTEASESGLRMPVGLAQGKLRVETDLSGNKQLTRRQGTLSMVDPNTGQMLESGGHQIYDYAATIARIHAAVGSQETGK
jgi:hypothetical protein